MKLRPGPGLPPPRPHPRLTPRAGAGLRALLHGGALVLGATAELSADAARWWGVRGPACPLAGCCDGALCPGCGLVRGTAAALRGDLGGACAAHPAAVAVAALLVAGLLLAVATVARGREPASWRRWRAVGQRAFAVAVLSGWALRLLFWTT